PLRFFHLIEMAPGAVLTRSPLRLDERILHFLSGVNAIDARLLDVLDREEPDGLLVQSHATLVERIAELWDVASGRPWPLIQLCGPAARSQRPIAAATCARLGLGLHMLSSPAARAPAEENLLARLATREARLCGSAIAVEHDSAEPAAAAPRRLLEQLDAPVF